MRGITRKVIRQSRLNDPNIRGKKKHRGMTITSIEGVRFGYTDTPLPIENDPRIGEK